MADGKVAFELASPEALVISVEADMVVVPGREGDFGVLPGHAPFISTVRPGVISVYQNGNVDRRLFVAGGFAEVNTEGCTVLSHEAMPVEDIDRARVEERLKTAREDLADADSDEERRRAEDEIAVCEAMLAAAA